MEKVSTEKIMREFVTEEWHFVTKRADIPVLPVWHKLQKTNSQEFKNIYNHKLDSFCFWEKGIFNFYLRGKDFKKLIKVNTDILLSKQKTKNHFKKLIKFCDLAKSKARFFYSQDLSKYSNKKLLGNYKAVISYYELSFFYGFQT
jgi:hypothetical protein